MILRGIRWFLTADRFRNFEGKGWDQGFLLFVQRRTTQRRNRAEKCNLITM